MKNVIIFGASATGRRVYKTVKQKYHVIAFVDENTALYGESIDGIEICSPQQIAVLAFDFIILAVLSKYEQIKDMLMEQGIEEERILAQYVDLPNRAREDFVYHMQQMLLEKKITGAIAELGVYQGEFSKVLGKYFKDNKFYLFDTFEGFPETDTKYDALRNMSSAQTGYFSNTSSDMVISKIYNPARCVVCKGYFPDTAKNVDDTFIFVNLDADLYQPTKEGLSFFYQRLQPGGVILVHDYFSTVYKGVKTAVDAFCGEVKVTPLPIGDTLSIAIIKNEVFSNV